MKTDNLKYVGLLVIMVVIALITTYHYPETCKIQEGDCYFLFTMDYFRVRLADIPALNSYITDFLYQFYRWPLAAGFIVSLLYGITSFVFLRAFKRIDLGASVLATGVALILPFLVVVLAPFILCLQLDAFFFSLALMAYVSCRDFRKRIIVCALIAPYCVLFINPAISIILFLFLSAIERFCLHGRAWVPLAGILLFLCAIYLYSQYVTFVSFERRILYVRGLFRDSFAPYILSYFLFVLIFIPFGKTIKTLRLAVCLIVCVLAGLIYRMMTNKESVATELFYTYASLAEHHKWDELLRTIRAHGGATNRVALRYALMAETGLGTLPENLFSYNIKTPDDFLFLHDREKLACFFNRQFYANISIYDEAMHHAMEYGLQTDNGTCFSTLRYMTECQIREGDYPVALKYLTILDKSLFNKEFVKMQRKRIAEYQKEGRGPISAIRADNFVGAYPFNSEMIRFAQTRTNNKVYIDYVLCGLLLQRNMHHFCTIIRGLNPYGDQEVPRAFAEAAAMGKAMGQNLHDCVNYSVKYDEGFLAFQKEYEGDNFNPGPYTGTYWRYFFCDEIWEAEQRAAAEKKSGNAPK